MSSRQTAKKKKRASYRPIVASPSKSKVIEDVPADDPGRVCAEAETTEASPEVSSVKASRRARLSRAERREEARQRRDAWVEHREARRAAGERVGLVDRWRIKWSLPARQTLVLFSRLLGWAAYVIIAYIVLQMLCLSFFPLLGGFLLRVTAAGVNNDMSYFIAAFVVPMAFMVILVALLVWTILCRTWSWLNRQIREFRVNLGL